MISWTIITGNEKKNQQRVHPEIFLNKVNKDEAKFIALHTGIFWGIGVFIIKNKDIITVKTDSYEMKKCVLEDTISQSKIIQDKVKFLKMLVKQRQLKIKFEVIRNDENTANAPID